MRRPRRLCAVPDAPLAEVAAWLVDQIGYPVECTTSQPIPEVLRPALVRAWQRRERGASPVEVAAWLAEEGGW